MTTDKKRETATIKMTPGKDDDLIRWFRKLPQGERNQWLKNALRAGMGAARVAALPDNAPSASTADDVAERLEALERQLEVQAQWIEYLNSQLEGRTVVMPEVVSPAPDEAQPRVDDEVLQGRAAKLKRAKW